MSQRYPKEYWYNFIREANLEILDEFEKVKQIYMFKCLICNHKWSTHFQSVKQSVERHNSNSCPNCLNIKKEKEYQLNAEKNIQKINDLGYDLLSDFIRRQEFLKSGTKIKVMRRECGHIFEVNPGNLISGRSTCPICNVEVKRQRLKEANDIRIEKFLLTASEWKKYDTNVRRMTRHTYKKNKNILNPNNYPLGLAGIDGMYHIDHIAPVRMCFEYSVPEQLCADIENLRVIPWQENLTKRANMIESIIPDSIRTYF